MPFYFLQNPYDPETAELWRMRTIYMHIDAWWFAAVVAGLVVAGAVAATVATAVAATAGQFHNF